MNRGIINATNLLCGIQFVIAMSHSAIITVNRAMNRFSNIQIFAAHAG